MNGKKKIVMTNVDELQRERDLKALLGKVKHGLSQEPLDIVKLGEILNALLKVHGGDVYALCQAGILAGVLEHWKAWRYVSDGLGAGGDPALGYIAYVKFVKLRPERDSPKAQDELLGTSSRMGSIPARILLLSKRRLKNPILRAAVSPLVFLYFSFVMILYWMRNKNDKRLPLSFRQRSNEE